MQQSTQERRILSVEFKPDCKSLYLDNGENETTRITRLLRPKGGDRADMLRTQFLNLFFVG